MLLQLPFKPEIDSRFQSDSFNDDPLSALRVITTPESPKQSKWRWKAWSDPSRWGFFPEAFKSYISLTLRRHFDSIVKKKRLVLGLVKQSIIVRWFSGDTWPQSWSFESLMGKTYSWRSIDFKPLFFLLNSSTSSLKTFISRLKSVSLSAAEFPQNPKHKFSI